MSSIDTAHDTTLAQSLELRRGPRYTAQSRGGSFSLKTTTCGCCQSSHCDWSSCLLDGSRECTHGCFTYANAHTQHSHAVAQLEARTPQAHGKHTASTPLPSRSWKPPYRKHTPAKKRAPSCCWEPRHRSEVFRGRDVRGVAHERALVSQREGARGGRGQLGPRRKQPRQQLARVGLLLLHSA